MDSGCVGAEQALWRMLQTKAVKYNRQEHFKAAFVTALPSLS